MYVREAASWNGKKGCGRAIWNGKKGYGRAIWNGKKGCRRVIWSGKRRYGRKYRHTGCERSRSGKLAVWICLIAVFSVIGGAAIEVAAGIGEAVGGLDASGGDQHSDRGAAPLNAVPIQQLDQDINSVSGSDLTEDVLGGDVFRKDPDKFLVALDPGHGGEDEGCSRQGVLEKDINLQIGLRVRDKLEEMGYQVVMTREDDTYLALDERVGLANQCGADAFISIHQNAFENVRISGLETWYYGQDTQRDSRRLAELIHREAVMKTTTEERELREDADFYVTTNTAMPACLVETGFLSNEKEREMLCSAEYQEALSSGIAQGIDLYFHPKTMYLTFDDGPSAENTAAVLDILKERGIKATFFVVGENVRKNPDVAKRIVEEGHTIGIHCNEHDYGKIYASVDSYLEDFQKAYDAVYEVTGVKPVLFRFPGGSINAYNKKVYEDIIEEMTAKGFIYFDWNASLEDAVSKSEPEELIANARESTLGRRKVVLLAHDIIHNTVLCLDELLDEFPEYRMEVLTKDVKPIQFNNKK